MSAKSLTVALSALSANLFARSSTVDLSALLSRAFSTASTFAAMPSTFPNFVAASSDKPMMTLPFSPVTIFRPGLADSAVFVVPSPVTKSKPCFKDTVFAFSSASPFVRYVIGASRSFTVTVASPKLTVPGSAFLSPSAALPGVTVIVFVPFLITRLSLPLPEIPFMSVKVSANFTTNPFASVVESFSTRMLTPAVASAAGVKFVAPFTVNVVPNARVTSFTSSPWNVNPFAMMSLAVLFKSLTFTAACFVFTSPAAVFKRSKNVGLAIGWFAPSFAVFGIAEATLLMTVVPPVVEPSGFTRRACGVFTSTASSAFVPSAFTLSAGYHLPSLAFTTRLPLSSVYTTVPASPLRSAFTFVVKSLPFKPSAPVKPSLPIPALSPVPGFPSRPSIPLAPSAPTALAISATFANVSFVA